MQTSHRTIPSWDSKERGEVIMSELKTFWATKTKVTMYKVRAESKKEAEELLRSKTPYAATETQKGVSTIWFDPELPEQYKVFEDRTDVN